MELFGQRNPARLRLCKLRPYTGGGFRFLLQLREIASLLCGHQPNMSRFERSQPVFSGPKTLLIVTDLILEELLSTLRPLPFASESLIHQGVHQNLSDSQRALTIAVLINDPV